MFTPPSVTFSVAVRHMPLTELSYRSVSSTAPIAKPVGECVLLLTSCEQIQHGVGEQIHRRLVAGRDEPH
jgi:hypothetical protein